MGDEGDSSRSFAGEDLFGELVQDHSAFAAPLDIRDSALIHRRAIDIRHQNLPHLGVQCWPGHTLAAARCEPDNALPTLGDHRRFRSEDLAGLRVLRAGLTRPALGRRD